MVPTDKILTDVEVHDLVKAMLNALERNWPSKPKSIINLSMVLGGAVANTAAKVADENGDEMAEALIKTVHHGAEGYTIFTKKTIH